jgi:alkylation response protein AidB-like acyl-CoA dehydrogenase
LRYANEEQKRKWLTPLLNGETRSCFAMTEPAVASSDATNIQSEIKKQGNSYVLNGRKWFITGGSDPRCSMCIFMGKTDPQAARHKQQSMVIVPMNTPGVTVLRPCHVFGFTDPPSGHAEILFENVKVPVSNLILGEGRGFEIAQGRLGPARIHHCMRFIGQSEYALELMIKRALTRTAFGKRLAQHGSVYEGIAKSRIEIEQSRLLTLKAAHMIDTVGYKSAAPEVAMAKVAVPQMALNVIDRAIQVHGACGLSEDSPLPLLFSWARVMKIADGPDEVHLAALAKYELKSKL